MGGPHLKEEDKATIRDEMLDKAFELIKKNGLTHTSVSMIAEDCGIGKGTFYHFFSSKEEMVYELMQKQAAESYKDFSSRFDANGKMSMQEGKKYLLYMLNTHKYLYAYLNKKDLEKLKIILGDEKYKNVSVEDDPYSGMRAYLEHVENVREDVDVKLVFHLFKLLNFANRNWNEETSMTPKAELIDTIFQHLCSLIFKE